MNFYWGKVLNFVALLSLVSVCLSNTVAKEIVLENRAGIKCMVQQTKEGYSLGKMMVNGKYVESPLVKGMMFLLNTTDDSEHWLFAAEGKKISSLEAVFSGRGSIDGSLIQFSVKLEMPNDEKAIRLIYDFSVDKDLNHHQAVLTYHDTYNHPWKCHMYPWAEDARYIQRDPLNWVGIPSLFLYRDDRSMGLLWGIDPAFDYLNPTTWTGDFGLYFVNGAVSPQYRVGGQGLKANINYHCPMQLIFTDHSDPDNMIIDLVNTWIDVNDFKVESLNVRSNDDALDLFMHGRENTSMWYEGKGYRLEMGDPSSAFIYIGEQGLSAYFEYLMYEITGNALWRKRAFEQMDFILKGQNTNPDDPNYGVVHTAYSLVDYGPAGKGFNSYDRGTNPGYKIDLNIYLGRYMLHMWNRVKRHEQIDRQDWYKAAILAIDWGLRQQNSDGGLPQKIAFEPTNKRLDQDWMGTGQPQYVKHPISGEKSISTTSGRALPALWHIYKITGNEKYQKFMKEIENYNLKAFQNKFLFNSHHPDLPPHTLEEAGIWGICEYWLNRYDETKNSEYLKHAEANAHLSLTWKCPKQLSWVDNPTQLGSAEQQYFLQYSVYCYQNRQVECLHRLYKHTGNKLYRQLAERITQNVYWTQVTEGDLKGATHERICDPWLARPDGGPAFNSMGTIYMSEQSLDLLLQIIEMTRMGDEIYFGDYILNKVYPDGDCLYNQDVTHAEIVNLHVLPSNGSVSVMVKKWNKTEKVWVEENAPEENISVFHEVGSLDPGHWYMITIDGQKSGKYQADTNGVVRFPFSGNIKETRTYSVVKE